MRYKTRYCEIEAHLWDGDWEALRRWADNASSGNGTSIHYMKKDNEPATLKIRTWEGTMDVPKGNYVICGLEGEFYSCAPTTFHKKYEVAE